MRNAAAHACAFERAIGRTWCVRREDVVVRRLRSRKAATERYDG